MSSKESSDQLEIHHQEENSNVSGVTMRYLNAKLITLLQKKFPGVPGNLLLQIAHKTIDVVGPRIVLDTVEYEVMHAEKYNEFTNVDAERIFNKIKEE